MTVTSRAAATARPADSASGPARAVFLPDGGPGVGLGHWRRCLTLAEALHEVGLKPAFYVGDAVLRDLCLRAGVDATMIGQGFHLAIEQLPAEAQVCVVDSYRVVDDDFTRLRERVGRLVCFDDLGVGPFSADLVINGAPYAEEMDYPKTGGVSYLLGPSYFMLRPDLRAMAKAPTRPSVEAVLLTVGGGDDHALLPKLAAWVRLALPEAIIHCLVGPYADPSKLRELASRDGAARTMLHRNTLELADMLRGIDVAITGGGQSACEIAACGVPAVGLLLGDDQRINLSALARSGALIEGGTVGNPDLERGVVEALRSLRDPQTRQRMAGKGRTLFDGQGAGRVAAAILALVAGGK